MDGLLAVDTGEGVVVVPINFQGLDAFVASFAVEDALGEEEASAVDTF
jgi:hypothetical protein